jgi:hypothetical protein
MLGSLQEAEDALLEPFPWYSSREPMCPESRTRDIEGSAPGRGNVREPTY